ncbi:unnamed protein product, partial [Mesorhabditis belari]|uniref:C2H2-type domain-containing protein n=1 Tax=Mesorhabditis belari TaxID=2138241 RepID=A0AAF3EA83_9BILA
MSFFSSFFEASKSCVSAIQSGDLTSVKQRFGTGLVSTLKALRNVLHDESSKIETDFIKIEAREDESTSFNSSLKINGFKRSESSEDFNASSKSIFFEHQVPKLEITDRTTANFSALVKSEQAAVQTCIATANTVITSFSIFQDVTGKDLDKMLPPKEINVIDVKAEDVRLHGFLPKCTSTPKTNRKPRLTELQEKMRENVKTVMTKEEKVSRVENGSETTRAEKRVFQSSPVTPKLQKSFTESRKRKVDASGRMEMPKSKNLRKSLNQSGILEERLTISTKETTIQHGIKPSSHSKDDTASTFTCKECLETIKIYQPLNLFKHILGHVPKNLYLFECEECEELFATRRDQKIHMAFKHASSKQTIRKDADRILKDFFQFGEKIFPECSPLLEISCNQMRIKIGLPSL